MHYILLQIRSTSFDQTCLSLSSDNRSLAQVGIKPNGSTHLVGKGVAIALSLLHCYAVVAELEFDPGAT